MIRSPGAASTRLSRWLKRLSELRGPDRPSPYARDATARNNHLYLRASVSMAWGALVGDKPSFRQG